MNAMRAAGLVFRTRPYRYLAAGLFALALTLYAFTLPAKYTGGVVGLISLRYLDGELLFFSVALAALLSLALTLNVYAFRATVRKAGRGATVGALASSLLPAAVCCTPLVPTLLALLGASTPRIFGVTGRIQGLFATYDLLILTFAVVLLLLALHLAGRSILGSCPLPARSAHDHDPKHETAP